MEFKKVEIIERITDSNGNVTENMLTVWKNLNLNNNSANLRIGELEVCESKRQVKKNEEHIYLTFYEFEILFLLVKNPGRVFSEEQIYDIIWNEPYSGDYNVVMRHICNIREKIEDDPGQPLYIQTVRGVGYRFNGNLGSE
ncbi:winged helix-turn-helix domain-containing protein [Blautia wexlerae]|uniref:winged helix-turn-helix domain-containing protein n=1 Tax=Blautia wexlerae TaxID=418240 RepID=UPI003D64D49D